MAENTPLENLILVTSVAKEEYMTALLIPQSDPAFITRTMALPGHYTHLFSMTAARATVRHTLGPKVFSLQQYSTRSPYIKLEGLENFFRTSWLGKAEDTINDEIKEVNELLERIKTQSVSTRYPKPAPGEAT